MRQLLKRTARPLVVVVDSASIHAAKAVRALLQRPEFQSLTLYFLPAYSPELNSGAQSSVSASPEFDVQALSSRQISYRRSRTLYENTSYAILPVTMRRIKFKSTLTVLKNSSRNIILNCRAKVELREGVMWRHPSETRPARIIKS
ncbi:transposase [Pseudomonas sp. TH31]|nr:transposase [Pseudomonas sp. TH31]